MAGRDVIDVDDVHAGFNVGRHPAFHEIHDDLAGRRRLHVALTDRCAGIHDDDRQSCFCQFVYFLFSKVLRAFVVAGHLFERHRRVFRPEPTARGQPDCADGAAIDRPFYADVASGFQQVPSAGHVDVIED